MAEESEQLQPVEAWPYVWNASEVPPEEVVQLWQQVGAQLDERQTIVWQAAVDTLEQAGLYLGTSKDARDFVEKYMEQIVAILVDQLPSKIGLHERSCVKESLLTAVAIVVDDLQIQVERNGKCELLPSLNHILNRKKLYYKGIGFSPGLSELRLEMVERFRMNGGFRVLHQYMKAKVGTPQFPPFETLYHIIPSLCDTTDPLAPEDEQAMKTIQDDAIAVACVVFEHIDSFNNDDLKKLPTEGLVAVQNELQKFFDRLIATRRSDAYHYYEFWRRLALKLISSDSRPLNLFGWEQIDYLISSCEERRPPPRSYVVSNTGVSFVNGEYQYDGALTLDGYARSPPPVGEATYVRVVPDNEEGGGKKLTLFRCRMRSNVKWWFLSEADEERPGTDEDVDYYKRKAKTKADEELFPPPDGWVTSVSVGVDPPPTLKAQGVLVPEEEEFNTLEHQLAKWAIENEVIEKLLASPTIHHDAVALSTSLINFLASMHDRVQPSASAAMMDRVQPFTLKYCLQLSHLLSAWKKSSEKGTAAASTHVYELLVSVVPICPNDMVKPVLKALHTSLLVDEVRDEVLGLFWSVLTKPSSTASRLDSCDVLKRYLFGDDEKKLHATESGSDAESGGVTENRQKRKRTDSSMADADTQQLQRK